MVVWGEYNKKNNNNGREVVHYGVYAQNIAKFSELQPGELLDTTLFLASGESDRSAAYSFMAILNKLKESLAIKTHKHKWKDITDAPDPVAPDIQIGNVTTGEAGTDATVTRRAGSPNNAPIFDFCIPQGHAGGVGPTGADGADGQDGKDGMACRTARFVVGTSAAGWTVDDCDYLCDGTNDQVEIQAAINALPTAGGKIIILSGTYNISDTIELRNVPAKIQGCGCSTILDGQNIGESKYVIQGNFSSTVIGISISDLKIVGGNNYPTIYMKSCQYCEVFNTWIVGNGISINFTSDVRVHHNIIDSGDTTPTGSKSGVYAWGSRGAVITDNIITAMWAGVCLNSYGSVIIANNMISKCSNGVYVQSSSSCNEIVIGNNKLYGNNVGIEFAGYRGIISGNICIRGTGTTDDYTSDQHTIKVTGSSCLVVDNFVLGKAVTVSGTKNTIVNNKDS